MCLEAHKSATAGGSRGATNTSYIPSQSYENAINAHLSYICVPSKVAELLEENLLKRSALFSLPAHKSATAGSSRRATNT